MSHFITLVREKNFIEFAILLNESESIKEAKDGFLYITRTS